MYKDKKIGFCLLIIYNRFFVKTSFPSCFPYTVHVDWSNVAQNWHFRSSAWKIDNNFHSRYSFLGPLYWSYQSLSVKYCQESRPIAENLEPSLCDCMTLVSACAVISSTNSSSFSKLLWERRQQAATRQWNFHVVFTTPKLLRQVYACESHSKQNKTPTTLFREKQANRSQS